MLNSEVAATEMFPPGRSETAGYDRRMSWETDFFAAGDRERAEQLARAESDARASGKELFDLKRFEALYNHGSQAANERQHRETYYLMHREIRTLADYARSLGAVVKCARTVEEMRFAASLEPCPSCQSSALGDLALSNQGAEWTLRGSCPSCGAPRRFAYMAMGNPTITPAGRYDLGPLGSELITPDQFLNAWAEASARLPSDPSNLSPALRARAADELTRATTAVMELIKLIPYNAKEVPGSSDPRLQRASLKAEYMRLRVLETKYQPPCSIDRAALAAHAGYVRAGAKGPGRLALLDRKLVGESYKCVDLTFVEMRRCDCTRIDLSEARLERALLEDDTFALALLRETVLVNATIRGGTWTKLDGSTARFNEARIDGADMSRSELEASLWCDANVANAKFDGSHFGNAVFDRATFQRCSFVAASFAMFSKSPEPTSAEARFVDCDLRDTDWKKRDLRGTTFVRCNFAGAHGKPTATDGLVLQDCSVDVAGLLAQLI